VIKPEWLKKQWRLTEDMARVEELVSELGLNTVCREASCPNYSDCLGRGTATFLILGANCTRSCGFCGVTCSVPEPVDPGEATRVAEAVKRLGLSYVVITSVTRDDLEDGGASEFARTVREIRRLSPKTRVETLIPDFKGSEAALDLVIEAAPDVISHNIETVRELYEKVRPQADYERSLDVLRYIKKNEENQTIRDVPCVWFNEAEEDIPCGSHRNPSGLPVRVDKPTRNSRLLANQTQGTSHNVWFRIKCKSGLMVGVGETDAQVRKTIDDLKEAGCSILTIGQYLRPSPENIPVEAYVEPEIFDRWAEYAKGAGYEFVASAPFVRSSYHAEEVLNAPLL